MLIKMINGVEKVLMLLFTAFEYEFLFWSTVVRVWIVRLIIREKIWLGREVYFDKIKNCMNIFTVTYFVLTFLYLTWFCNHWIETPLFLCTQYWIDERTTTYSWCLLVYLFAETGVGAVITTGWAIVICDPTGVTPNLIRASTWRRIES